MIVPDEVHGNDDQDEELIPDVCHMEICEDSVDIDVMGADEVHLDAAWATDSRSRL